MLRLMTLLCVYLGLQPFAGTLGYTFIPDNHEKIVDVGNSMNCPDLP